METNTSDQVICCFCGDFLFMKDAAVLILLPNFESEESQQLFCHKNHLVERVNKAITLHPDLFED